MMDVVKVGYGLQTEHYVILCTKEGPIHWLRFEWDVPVYIPFTGTVAQHISIDADKGPIAMTALTQGPHHVFKGDTLTIQNPV